MHSAGLFLALSTLVAAVSAGAPPEQQVPAPGTVAPAGQDQGKETPCPTLPPMADGKCKLLKDQDRPGFDLTSVKAPLKDCAKKCEATDGCRTWSWNDYEGGTCWLKSRGAQVVDKAGVWTTSCVDKDEPTSTCKPLHDVDFEGNDIAMKPGKEYGDCCSICNSYPGCKAYSWSDWNGGSCWLKSGVTKAVRKAGVKSSAIVPLGGPVCPFEFDTDFVANDIGNAPAKDAGVCCSQCKANKACKAYSWSNWNGGTCWMKSGKGQVVKRTGVVSALLESN